MKRAVFLASLMTIASAGALVMAQQTSVVPQPRADALPAPGAGSPKLSRTIPKPDGVMPTVPAGFTVTTYAELMTPRMMVYAPNGDLFVSSPAANTIVVLRDANNDGRFEACSVFAAGEIPGAGRGGRGLPPPPPLAVPPGCSGPLTNPNVPPPPPPRRLQVRHQRLPLRRLVVPPQVAAHRVCAVVRGGGTRLAVLRRRALAALVGDAVARLCSVRTRRPARHRRSSFRKGPANFARRSASLFMTAISMSATPRRSSATSTRTAI